MGIHGPRFHSVWTGLFTRTRTAVGCRQKEMGLLFVLLLYKPNFYICRPARLCTEVENGTVFLVAVHMHSFTEAHCSYIHILLLVTLRKPLFHCAPLTWFTSGFHFCSDAPSVGNSIKTKTIGLIWCVDVDPCDLHNIVLTRWLKM